MSLSYLSSDDGLIFCCFLFCGALGLLLCLKSKKHKGSDSLSSLMGNYHKSYLHAYLSEFLGQSLKVSTRVFIKDDVINGRFININVSRNNYLISISLRLSNCTAITSGNFQICKRLWICKKKCFWICKHFRFHEFYCLWICQLSTLFDHQDFKNGSGGIISITS